MYRDLESFNFCGIILHPQWTSEQLDEEIRKADKELVQLTECHLE